MTTYTKETALYNTNAIANDIDDAENAYKTVITEVGTSGIKLHPSGQSGDNIADYTLINDSGMEVFDGGTSVAAFGASGARIGKPFVNGGTANESHLEMDYNTFQMLDKENVAFFKVEDLRDSSGYATLTETFTVSGSTSAFTLEFQPRSLDTTSATVNGNNRGISQIANVSTVILSSAASNGSTVVVTYQSNSDLLKAYTFGRRLSTGKIGPHSVAEGYDTIASGIRSHAEGMGTTASGGNSHAEGYNTVASGRNSHAEGYETTASGSWSHAEGGNTIASGSCSHASGINTTASGAVSYARGNGAKASSDYQTALGKFNEEDTNDKYAVIVGNGIAESAPLNVAALDWDGNLELAGGLVAEDDCSIDANLDVTTINGVTVGSSPKFSDTTALGSMTGTLGVAHGGTGITNFCTTTDADGTTAQSTTSGTAKALKSVSLAAGKWLVLGYVWFAANATGRRNAKISTTSADVASGIGAMIVPAVNGVQTELCVMAFVQPTSTTTYYLNGYQNSGGALNAACYIRAIRLG